MFEFLFKYPLAAYRKGEFLFATGWSVWLLAALAAVAALGLLVYARRVPSRLNGAALWGVWALQVATATLVLVLLWQPALAVQSLKSRQNAVAVLVDTSSSMSLVEDGLSRLARAAGALQETVMPALAEKFRVRLYGFSAKPERIGSLRQEDIPSPGASSGVGESVLSVLRESTAVPLGALLVVSDGAFTGSFLVDILHLDDLSRQHSVDFDVCEQCIFSEARLLDRHGRLVFYVQASTYHREHNKVRRNLGLNLHTGEFETDITRGDISYLYHTGAQSGGVDGSDIVVWIGTRERSPNQPYVKRGPKTFDLNWRLPDPFSMPQGGRLVQLANNDQARVLFVSASTSRWLVFDKSSRQWSSVPSSTFPAVGDERLLGPWLVREEVLDGHDNSAWRDADPKMDAVPFWPAHAGDDQDPFWSSEIRASLHQRTPTGRLHFYDTRTGNVVWHDTGHIDSETLLIDDRETVYFRVGDQLRVADLVDGRLANERTVVQAPEILAVHWLFQAIE